MRFVYGGILAIIVFVFLAEPTFAGTTIPPNLTITQSGKIVKTVPIFDKWTNGATLAIGDLGTDGVSEIIVGAGPGSVPEIRIFRQDGSLINKFNAFDAKITKGVIVNLRDIDADGTKEIVVATGPKFGKFVRIFNGYGKLLQDWYPIPEGINSVITAATLDDTQTIFTVPKPNFIGGNPDIPKEIVVSLKEQRLYAFQGGLLVNTYLISSGLKRYPTVVGTYYVQRKEAIKRYVGPGYNLPNTHWNTRFSNNGYYFHEAYWHNNFGTEMSHGCINMRKDDAKFIYDWADIGTRVTVS